MSDCSSRASAFDAFLSNIDTSTSGDFLTNEQTQDLFDQTTAQFAEDFAQTIGRNDELVNSLQHAIGSAVLAYQQGGGERAAILGTLKELNSSYFSPPVGVSPEVHVRDTFKDQVQNQIGIHIARKAIESGASAAEMYRAIESIYTEIDPLSGPVIEFENNGPVDSRIPVYPPQSVFDQSLDPGMTAYADAAIGSGIVDYWTGSEFSVLGPSA